MTLPLQNAAYTWNFALLFKYLYFQTQILKQTAMYHFIWLHSYCKSAKANYTKDLNVSTLPTMLHNCFCKKLYHTMGFIRIFFRVGTFYLFPRGGKDLKQHLKHQKAYKRAFKISKRPPKLQNLRSRRQTLLLTPCQSPMQPLHVACVDLHISGDFSYTRYV